MNKKQALDMLKFISELYAIISAPEPAEVQNGRIDKDTKLEPVEN